MNESAMSLPSHAHISSHGTGLTRVSGEDDPPVPMSLGTLLLGSNTRSILSFIPHPALLPR